MQPTGPRPGPRRCFPSRVKDRFQADSAHMSHVLECSSASQEWLRPGAARVFTKLVSEFGKQRQWRRSLELFEDVKHQGLKPNIITYSVLISACEKGKEMSRAFDVCADMLRQALKPNMVSYSALISACEKCKEMRRAFDV